MSKGKYLYEGKLIETRENREYILTKKGLEKAQTKNTPERMIHQSAYSVAAVAYSELSRGNTTSDTELKVNYLRPSQAERELMNKNKN